MKIFDPKLTGSIEFQNPVQGNIEITGDLVVPGSITAREFKTEFVSASIIYKSGSTQFGDTVDDVHIFSGSTKFYGTEFTIKDNIYNENLLYATYMGATIGTNTRNIPLTVWGNGTINGTAYASTGNFKLDSGYEVSWGNGNTSILGNTSSNYLDFRVNNGVKMLLNTDGNLGIGTASPSTKLHVVGNQLFDGVGLVMKRTGVLGGQNWNFGVDNSGLSIYDNTNTTYRFTIASGGNIGIANSSPSQLLHVGGTSRGQVYVEGTDGSSPTVTLDHTPTTSGRKYILYSGGTATGNFDIYDATAGAGRLSINSAGYVGIGTSSPGTALHVWQTAPIISMTDSNSFSDTADRFQIRAGGDQGLIQWWDNSASSLLDLMTFEPNGQIATNSTSGLNWSTTSTGGFTVGNAAGSSLLVRTNSLNTSYNSGLAIDGTHASQRSVINIKALGVYSGGYDSHLAFYTTDNTTLSEKMRITNAGYVGIGTDAPSDKFQLHDGIFKLSNSVSGRFSTLGHDDNYNFYIKNTVLGNLYIGNGTTTYVDGHLNVDSGTLYVNQTSNNVGIGTTAPDSKLHIKTTSGDAKVTIESPDDSDAFINYSGASAEWSAGYDRTAGEFIFAQANSIAANPRFKIRSSGIHIVPGLAYSQTYTYTSDWNANFQDVVPTGTLTGTRVYLFTIWTNSFGTPPYYAAASAIITTAQNTNSGGNGPEVDLITAHHVGSTSKWQLRTTTAGNSTNGVQVKLLNGPSVSSVAVFIRVTEISDY